MARSIRVFYPQQQGRIRKNFNWPPINVDSAVVITAAEFSPQFGGFSMGFVTPGRPHLGEANVYVTNVGPHGGPGGEAGGVEFHLHVEHSQPLDVIVTISVLENIEQFA
jgi:hypothetical protein